MSLASLTEVLARDVAAFLDTALVKRVPERDKPVAESLCVRAALSWPVDDDGWTAAQQEVAKRLAEHFGERVSDWARVLYLTALYLSYAGLDAPHPREDPKLRVVRRGKQLRRVELDLARAFAEALIEQADRTHRMQLFETLDEWAAWQTVARALESLALQLTPSEILTVLTRAIEFSWGNDAASTILDHIGYALAASPTSVDEILWGWLGADDNYVDADVRAIGKLALWRLPQHSNAGSLRRRLVHQFARLPKDGPMLAPRIAFRSWPNDAPLTERSELLLATLERLGNAGVSAALEALAYDPSTPRSNAFEIVDAIMAHLATPDQNVVIELVRVLHWLADDETSDDELSVSADEIIERFPPPEAFTLHSMPWLDRALATLTRRALDPVRGYVLDWIETFAEMFGPNWTLARLLPTTRTRLPGDAWLVEAAVSQRPRLRRGAIRCLVEPGSHDERAAGFEALTPLQVHALALLMLSQATAGEAIVDVLFELARVRLDCLNVLIPLLGEPAMRTFPGKHRRCVEAWAKAVEERAHDAQAEAVATLQELLEARERDARVRFSVREPLFERTLPAWSPAAEIFTRQVRKVMRAHASPLREAATRIPIACGEATTVEFGDGSGHKPTLLEEHSNKMEGLFLDAYDPVAAVLARSEYEREAHRLLDVATQEDLA
jgi:hypothetical protein